MVASSYFIRDKRYCFLWLDEMGLGHVHFPHLVFARLRGKLFIIRCSSRIDNYITIYFNALFEAISD